MPRADQKKILTILEKRLNEIRFEGFSDKTLKDRNEILTQISRILLEPEKRRIYEEYYVRDSGFDNEKSWEIPQGSEIGGLILLLEAGQAEEAIRIGNIIYSKWKSNIGIHGTVFQDLILLIDNASLEFAKQLRAKRFFESSAEIIKKRIRKVDNGKLEIMQRRLISELEELKPFYILDLISRNSSEKEHAQGIEELKKMVSSRGGLEVNSSKYMSDDEFRAFLRQIRKYLNVQEQVDLFQGWSQEGSDVGSFLTGIALVASGFAQRKPERLVDALQVLNQIDTQDLETFKANIYLLLGDIEKADVLLSKFGDEELKAWVEENGTNRLAQQCEWCKEWLERDVLCGYRDLEVEPDLEAYFSDRDVITYIERIDSKSELNKNQEKSSDHETVLFLGGADSWTGVDNRGGINQKINQIRKGIVSDELTRVIKQAVLAITVISIISGFLYLLANHMSKNTGKVEQSKVKVVKTSPDTDVRSKKAGDMDTVASKEFLKALLNQWFSIKQGTLAGKPVPVSARRIATGNALGKLDSERTIDQQKGETQNIVVNIRDLKILRSSRDKIEVEVILDYKDQRVDGNGKIVELTPRHDFIRKYTVINDKGRWKVD
ncbi:MAG: hypothetical protein RLZZ609_1342 [Cyanobacteriota bacterium]|jgi:hypothetical protein